MSNEIAIKPDTNLAIRNSHCTICGKAFNSPRAAKFYCSSKCKQFAYYHKKEITLLKHTEKGLNSTLENLNLKDYNWYINTYSKVTEYKDLIRRMNSTYAQYEPHHAKRHNALEKSLPEYLKEIRLPYLSLEEWSFLKLLFKNLKNEDFINLITSLDNNFLECLTYAESNK